MKEIKVDGNKLVKRACGRVTINMRCTGMGRAIARLRIAATLVRLAAWVAGSHARITTDVAPDKRGL